MNIKKRGGAHCLHLRAMNINELLLLDKLKGVWTACAEESILDNSFYNRLVAVSDPKVVGAAGKP